MVPDSLLAAVTFFEARSLLLLPLIIVVSLVYNASHYESPLRILRRAARLSLTLSIFMGIVLIVLLGLSWGL